MHVRLLKQAPAAPSSFARNLTHENLHAAGKTVSDLHGAGRQFKEKQGTHIWSSEDLEHERKKLSSLRILFGIKQNPEEMEDNIIRTNMTKNILLETHRSNWSSPWKPTFPCYGKPRPGVFFADFPAVCYEESECAQKGSLEEILARKKATTTMYTKAYIVYGVTCAQMGYGYDKKPHPCYPRSMTTVFYSAEAQTVYRQYRDKHIQDELILHQGVPEVIAKALNTTKVMMTGGCDQEKDAPIQIGEYWDPNDTPAEQIEHLTR